MGGTPGLPTAGQPGPMLPGEYVPPGPPNVVTFNLLKIGPPSPLYIQRDDQILLRVQNSATGASVRFHYRFLRPDGVVVPGFLSFTPTADRTLNSFAVSLGEGFLLDAMSSTAGVPTLRGQTFVSLQVMRGALGTATTVQVLTSDYITGSNAITWPAGQIRQSVEGPGVVRSITGTTPGLGAEISETVPTNARWRPMAFRFSLVASAAAANRESNLTIDDGTNIYALSTPANTQIAGQTFFFDFNLGTTRQAALQRSEIVAPLPAVVMLAGHRIRTLTANIQGGDQYTAPQYLVEEWIEQA